MWKIVIKSILVFLLKLLNDLTSHHFTENWNRMIFIFASQCSHPLLSSPPWRRGEKRIWTLASEDEWFHTGNSAMSCKYMNSTVYVSDVPIIGNNRLINRRSCWLWWSILIFNNRSSDACTKHAITRFICTTRPQGNEVSDTDSLLYDWQ